jgi:hypothetical protein
LTAVVMVAADVIFITRNPHHAYPIVDRSCCSTGGRSIGYWRWAMDMYPAEFDKPKPIAERT